jgi:hypothetical protein
VEPLVQLLLVVALVGAAVLFFRRGNYVFVVHFRDGVPHTTRGKVSGAFLQDLAAFCAENGIRDGWVGGVPHGKRVRLAFSRHFSEAQRQRLRNLWVTHA